MKSWTVSRRSFLGTGAALGSSAALGFGGLGANAGSLNKPYFASAGSLVDKLDEMPTKITKIETIPLSFPVKPFADGADKTGGISVPRKFDQGMPGTIKPKRNDKGYKLKASSPDRCNSFGELLSRRHEG